MKTGLRLLFFCWVLALSLIPFGLLSQCGMSVTIQADPPPPYNLCPGETITLTSTVFGGVGPYSYEWHGAWPGILTTQNIELSPPYQGGVYLDVYDANGCYAFGAIHIKAWAMTVEITYNPAGVCQGDSLLLNTSPVFPPGSTFLWSTGQTIQNIYVYGSGTYSVTVTNPAGCTESDDVTVLFYSEPVPMPVIVGPSMLCEGQSAILSVEGGPFAWYYWSNFFQDETMEINGPGTYWVSVANGVGCTSTDSFIVESGGLPPILEGPLAICPGQQGIISITNAAEYISYNWSTGSTTSSTTINTTGTFTVTVTAAGGCTATGNFTVSSTNANIDLTGVVTAVTSCASPNGAINLTVSPIGSYTFLWSNGSTTEDLANLSPGMYAVTVTDAGGCTSGTIFDIPSSTTTPFILSTITPTTCDQSNGTINLNVTPPAGTYTFIWSNGASTEDLNNISAGTYNVTVTSVSNGCTATATAIVNNTIIDVSVTGNITQPSGGMNNGAIDISVAPAGTYTFIWSNGSTMEDLTGLAPGTYSVTVSTGSCTEVAVFVLEEITLCTGFDAFISDPIGNVFCIGDQLTLTTFTIGGTEPFTYLWSTGGTSSTETITVTEAINVFLTVTDANGCATSSSQYIEPLLWWAEVHVVGDPVCIGDFITLESSYNTGTAHLWSTGETTSSIQVNAPGIYSVTITDVASGCTNELEITPEFLSGLSVEIDGPASICAGQPVVLNVTGGPFNTYSWSGGQTTPEITVTSAGTYAVTVSNGTGCDGFDEIIIEEGMAELPILQGSANICSGQSSEITITNSTNYSNFLWSTGETTSAITVSTPDVYSVTVTSIEGCTAQENFTLTEDPNAPMINADVVAATCSENNGSIDLTVFPTGNYTYQWSNGSTAGDQNNIPGGTYTVTVTSLSGCTAIENVIVPDENIVISISGAPISNTSCVSANGAIDIAVDPAGIFSFEWSNGVSTEDLNDLSAGLYTVTVTLGLTCVETETFAVDNALQLPEIAGTVSQNSSCDQPNGAIDISITPSGTYSAVWSNGELTEDLQQLSGGSYSVTVTDGNGCSVSEMFVIINTNSPFSFEGVVTANQSCVTPDGAIDLTVSPTGAYTYTWSNGAITEDLQGLAAGIYMITVSDVNNCSVEDQYIIDEAVVYPSISAQITAASCGESIGAIDITVTPPDNNQFLWSNGSNAEDQIGLAAGEYFLTVSGVNGCTTTDTFTILSQATDFSLAGVTTSNNSCQNPNGTIDLTITPAGAYSIVWSDGNVTEDLQDLSAGMYVVTVTDMFNCMSSSVFIVEDNVSSPAISAVITPATCGANNGAIDLSANPPGNNTFLWSNGDTTEDLQNVLPGNYTVIVTDANGCQATQLFTVPNQNSNFSVSAVPISNSSCVIPNGSIDLIVIPPGVYTFTWSNGMNTEDLIGLDAGAYTVTVTDLQSCSSTVTVFVGTEIPGINILTATAPATCGMDNGSISVAVDPPAIEFAWSNGDTTESIQQLAPGLYVLTITDISGCETIDSFEVTDISAAFSISATTTNHTSCASANGGVDLTIEPAGNYDFLWSNGAMTEDLQSVQAGVYTVTVTDATNCSATDAFSVAEDVVNLVASGTTTPGMCGEQNGGIDLAVIPQTGNTYLWSNGSTQEDLEQLSAGTYSVTITAQNGCTWSSGFVVTESLPVAVDIQADMINANGDQVTIIAVVNVPVTALDTIIWLPADMFDCTQEFCFEQTITMPAQQTEISIMVFDTNGCMAQASLFLEAAIDPSVYIPNVFSPNADGVNDLFTVFGNEDVEEIVELRIFDRWGTFVFMNTHFPPNELNYGWDGTFKNSTMNPAVFVYWAKVRFIDGSEDFFKGDVTLVK